MLSQAILYKKGARTPQRLYASGLVCVHLN
nr:MAG TPA: hypothetical protein [Caudoviricetes sp.]